MAFLLVKVLFKRNGEFSSQHIHDSQAMKDRGIHCVLDQDREMRNQKRLKLKASIKWEQSQACLSYAERERARYEVSRIEEFK